MKKINYILIIVAVLGIVFAFSIFSKEGIAINVNSKNKDLVSKSLNGEIENTDDVTKIILGQGWHSGELTIYHSLGKTETLYITEGMFNLGELEKYIRENGYNLDNIGFISIGVSSIILIYLIYLILLFQILFHHCMECFLSIGLGSLLLPHLLISFAFALELNVAINL